MLLFILLHYLPKILCLVKSVALQYSFIPPLGLPICVLWCSWIDYLHLQKNSGDQTEMKVVNPQGQVSEFLLKCSVGRDVFAVSLL